MIIKIIKMLYTIFFFTFRTPTVRVKKRGDYNRNILIFFFTNSLHRDYFLHSSDFFQECPTKSCPTKVDRLKTEVRFRRLHVVGHDVMGPCGQFPYYLLEAILLGGGYFFEATLYI